LPGLSAGRRQSTAQSRSKFDRPFLQAKEFLPMNRVRGFLDRCDAEALKGWFVDDGRPGTRVVLDALYGGEVLATCVANQYRQDLKDARVSDGYSGFSVPVQDLDLDVMSDQLILKVQGTEAYLGSSEREARPVSETEVVPADVQTSISRRWPLCFLHIGFEKTGSTSIQRYLGKYREEFRARGYLVPLAGADRRNNCDTVNHLGLASLAVDENAYPADFRSIFDINDAEALAHHRDRFLRDLVMELTNAGEFHSVILSNEHCQSRLTSFREVARLKILLNTLFERVIVVAFIRPQHEVALSLYDSSLRVGLHNMHKIPDFTRIMDPDRNLVSPDYFDYFNILSRWASVFGRDFLKVRIYPGNRSRRGSVSDFLEALEIADMPTDEVLRENQGFSPVSRAVLEAINESLVRRGKMLSSLFKERVCEELSHTQAGHWITPDRQSAQDFFASFDTSNEAVRRSWFPERAALFDVDFTRYSDTERDPGQQLVQDALVDILMAFDRNFLGRTTEPPIAGSTSVA
jgi:hypothetical protein